MKGAKDYIAVIIPTAGVGKRMGQTKVNKPYLLLKGKTIILHILDKFLHLAGVKEIIIAIHPKDRNRINKVVAGIKPARLRSDGRGARSARQEIKVVLGGATRQVSVFNALKQVSPESEIVLIHDAVRPFVKQLEIIRLIKAVKRSGAAILSVPVIDTIKRVSQKTGLIKETIAPREELWLAQTPQGFKKEIILAAYRYARQNRSKVTDDASLVEKAGYPVKVIQGSYENIKITTRRDIVV